MSAMPGCSITPEPSAQKLLGITPRTTSRWPADMRLQLQSLSASAGRQ
ncbi:hypothetical protein QFZ43_000670 [Streptomyces afghaniensis]|nr:hypothetical protein [Streptomyces afghaniensis]